jgi:hypothetical protein
MWGGETDAATDAERVANAEDAEVTQRTRGKYKTSALSA